MTMTTEPPRPVISNLRVAALPSAVRMARHFAQYVLETWRLAELSETTCLLVSELVTNAVRATGCTDHDPDLEALAAVPSIRLQLQGNAGGVLAEVWDCDDTSFPVVQTPSDEAIDGRGLLLVAQMSTRWGVYQPQIGGKVVWFQLARIVPEIQIPIETDEPKLPQRITKLQTSAVRYAEHQADIALLERVLVGLHQLQGAGR